MVLAPSYFERQPVLAALDLPTPLNAEVMLRRAEAADLPALRRLLADDVLGAAREATVESEGYAQALERLLADPGNDLVLGERAGEVIAMLQLTSIPGISRGGSVRLNVEAVRVRSDSRSTGLGSAMLRWVIDAAAPACAAGLIQLTSDASRLEAHQFYQRLGFSASHLGFKLRLNR